MATGARAMLSEKAEQRWMDWGQRRGGAGWIEQIARGCARGTESTHQGNGANAGVPKGANDGAAGDCVERAAKRERLVGRPLSEVTWV